MQEVRDHLGVLHGGAGADRVVAGAWFVDQSDRTLPHTAFLPEAPFLVCTRVTASCSNCAATCMGLTWRWEVLKALAMRASLRAVFWLMGTLGRIVQLGLVGRPGYPLRAWGQVLMEDAG